MSHPDTVTALAALARLQTAWGYLCDQLEPGPTTRGEHVLSAAARGRLTRLHREERADRLATLKSGATPAGASPAPVRLAVVDARILLVTTTNEAAWIAASALRTDGPMLGYNPVVRSDEERFQAAASYLRIALPRCQPELANTIGQSLADADRTARAVAGVGNDRRQLKAECPACGGRSLEADVGAEDELAWTVTCSRAACQCRGIDCGCGLPLRYGGMRHLWNATRFPELARTLERTAT